MTAPDTLSVSRFVLPADDADAAATYVALLDGALDTTFLEPFAMTCEVMRMARLPVLSLVATRRVTRRLASRIAVDRLDAIHVQYVVAGHASGDADGRAVASVPGGILLLDYRRPFAITDMTARTVCNVAVPRHMVGTGLVDPAGLHGSVLSDAAAAPLIAFMHALHDRAGGFADSTSRAGRTLARAERWVDFKLGSPELGPAWLADKLRLSRSELYQVMEPFGGVARFIQGRRLRAAHAALSDPGDTRRIGQIAQGLGFASEAHFSRSFKRAFGRSPSAWRAEAAGQPPQKTAELPASR